MVNPITHSFPLVICASPQDAIDKGYDYSKDPSIKPVEVKEVVLVRNGTQGGNSTVDFILQDDSGQKYVFLVTRRLLDTIPSSPW